LSFRVRDAFDRGKHPSAHLILECANVQAKQPGEADIGQLHAAELIGQSAGHDDKDPENRAVMLTAMLVTLLMMCRSSRMVRATFKVVWAKSQKVTKARTIPRM